MRFFGGFVMEEQIDQKIIKEMHTAITCHDSTTCFIMSKLGNTLNFRQMLGKTGGKFDHLTVSAFHAKNRYKDKKMYALVEFMGKQYKAEQGK
jgi:hypothetical protein